VDRVQASYAGVAPLLTTSDPDLSAEDVALGYKNLMEASGRSAR
jgi:hypothetical protein